MLLLMLLIRIIGFAAANCRSGSSSSIRIIVFDPDHYLRSGLPASLLLFRCCCCNQRRLTDADAPAVDRSTAVVAVVAVVADGADLELNYELLVDRLTIRIIPLLLLLSAKRKE